MLQALRWLLFAPLALACASSAETVAFTVERDVAYAAGADARQRGDLFRPAGEGPHPALLVIHGGSWTRGSRARMEPVAERFAAAGYVVFNVDYRLAPEHTHPAQIDDVRAAFAWLRDHAGAYGVDPARIAALGYSSGGHLALLLGLEDAAARPAAVIGGAAPSDLRVWPRSPLIRNLLGGSPDERPEAWQGASPITHVSADDPPVLLYHGTLDNVVDVEHSRRLHERLQAEGVSSRLVEQKWAGHATAFVFDEGSLEAALVFLDESLARPGSDAD